MPKSLLLVLICLSFKISTAQTSLIQEDFSSGIPAGWQVIDEDGFTPHSSLSQFNDGWIWYTENSDSSIATTSYFQDTVAASSDYLILPQISIDSVTKLSWDERSIDASYPDGYHVLVSTTDSSISSFTDTLLTVDAAYFLWKRKSLLLNDFGYEKQDIYIAFHHFTEDGYILELDNIWVETSDFASNSDITPDQLKVNIYPNPAVNSLTVDTEQLKQVEVFSMAGQQLISTNSSIISVIDLKKGVYLIQVTTESGTFVEQFIKE